MAATDPEISRNLMPGERVQWSGQPGQGIQFTGRDLFLVPFSLFWCGILGFMIFTILSTPAVNVSGGAITIVVPVVMLLFGLAFMLGRFPLDAWLRSRTAYAVTNQRVLIVRAAPFGNFTAVNLSRIPSLKYSERTSGRGTLRFGETMSLFGNRSFSVWLPSLDPTPQFMAIDSAKSVFDLIQRLSQTPG